MDIFAISWIAGMIMMGSIMVLHTGGVINIFRTHQWGQTVFFGGMMIMVLSLFAGFMSI